MERKEKRGKVDEQAWLSKGAAILTDIKEWRRAHPKATFVEIEDEIHRRMMELEAQVLQDAAQESLSREWGQTPGQSVPVCPACAVPLQARGQHRRTLQGNGGQSVTLSRTYGTCPSCQKSFFPPR
jgi:RNase P subunit RPR2